MYSARDTRLGRVAAIKTMGEHFLGDETARVRLMQEARAAWQLNHAHICTIHEVGDVNGLTYIVIDSL